MIALKNILVATDFGDAAETALNYGRDLARTFGSTLHVLHVVDDVMVRFVGEGTTALLPDLKAEVEYDARKRLNAIITDDDRAVLCVRPVIVTSLNPAETIVDYAREHAINLVIMGTHGRKALAHALMGSVAERVVRSASCPVLTVRHPEREFLAPDALMVLATA